MSHAARAAPLGIRVTTYAALEKIVHAFAAGHFQLLILLGSHGLGKSRLVRQGLPGPSCWLEGNTSVFGLYCALWRHRTSRSFWTIWTACMPAAMACGYSSA